MSDTFNFCADKESVIAAFQSYIKNFSGAENAD